MSTIYDYRLAIKTKLLASLYADQLKFWNRKLRALSTKNAMCHGRQQRVNLSYAVFFGNREWRPQHLDWTEDDTSAYCLPLHSAFPEMQEEMAVIADELGEIEEERHEADRFLSGLVLFKAPPSIFLDVLGETLYEPCQVEIEAFCSKYPADVWDRNGEFSMNIFVEKYQYIIIAMKSRILVNLVTLGEL